jgi:hypothetical protein
MPEHLAVYWLDGGHSGWRSEMQVYDGRADFRPRAEGGSPVGGLSSERKTIFQGGRRRMKIAAKVMGGVLLASAAMTAPLQAQPTVSYYTQGFFSIPSNPGLASCNSTPFNAAIVVPLGASCTGAGFTLTYLPEETANVGSGSIVSLGNFNLTGTGAATAPENTVLFTLAIRQTMPTVGTGFTDGFISGTVTSNPNFSSLIWVPDQIVNIDATTYRLIFDNVGFAANIGIGIPINSNRSIQAEVTTIPEPASMALVATGLIGIFGVLRRRNSSSTVA